MWMHVPSIQSQYAAAMRASDLACEKLSELESSAMWKSNFQQSKSWQNVWRKRPSMRLLSGLTSEPSTLSRGVEKWICSLEDSRVSHFRLQESENRKTTSETSGPMSPDLLGGLGFQSSFFSKTSVVSCDTTGTPYDPNYERWVTKLRRDSSQRPKLGLHTGVSDSLSWPTARASMSQQPTSKEFQQENPKGRIEAAAALFSAQNQNWPTVTANPATYSNGFMGPNLIEAAKNWLTPRVSSANGPSETELEDGNPKRRLETEASLWPTPNTRDTRRGCNQKQLATEVDKWPTPNASEHKYRMQGNSQQSNGLTATARKSLIHSTHQDQETGTDGTGSSDSTQTSHQPSAKKDTMCSPKCRRLNPAFAEHLMGLPLGWTQTSGYDSSATESYQQFRHSLSELLREN